jgi:predicted NBD/HSP70 family sugar kinase
MTFERLDAAHHREPSKAVTRGNNLDSVRRHNLSVVLDMVHSEAPVSRARLTAATGLNRSTIAALVAELVQLDYVRESEPDVTTKVGRPSFVIEPSDRLVALAVHPELDAVTVGLVGLGHRVLRRIRVDNPDIPTAAHVVEVVRRVVAELRPELDAHFQVVGIGVAVPGLVALADGVVSLAPHLAWRDERLADMLQDATGYPVWVANDASLGAIAESRFGAGRGVDNVIFLHGGASGIGGGVIVSGSLLTGAQGFAGELGHTLVNSRGTDCHCGATGCLETEVQRQPLLDELGLGPDDSDLFEDALVAAFAPGGGGSAQLRAMVESQLSFLGIAIASFVNIFNPSLIVLGGFLGSLHRIAPDRVERDVRSRALIGARDGVFVTRSALGRDLLTVGAAELALSRVLADPAG